MRRIGKLKNKEEVKSFQDYLFYYGIESHNYDDPNDFDLWVLHDGQRQEALKHLEDFLNNPENQFQKKINEGHQKAKAEAERQKIKEKNFRIIDARTSVMNNDSFSLFSITGFMLSFSVLVFLAISYGKYFEIFRLLSFTMYVKPTFYEISHGQIWRLITPIFLHGGFWHILFNMGALYQIGPKIEGQEGSLFYALIVLITALVSNFMFYVLVGPGMVGISGVLFALIGYAWANYRINPNVSKYFEIQLYARQLVFFCIICFFLKLTNIVRIANVSHTFGALTGMILGYARAYLSKQSSVPLSWLWTNRENRQAIILTLFLTATAIYVDRIGL